MAGRNTIQYGEKKMNVKTFLISAVCGAAAMFAASCTTVVYPENYTLESNVEINTMLMTQGKCFIGLEPGRVYISDSFANVFKLEEMASDLNEEGLLMAMVTGRTSSEAFWPWTLDGTSPYELLYTFIWFDADGKCVTPPVKHVFSRRTLPGDIVKFSFLAPNENCKKFSFIVGLAVNEAESVSEVDEPKAAGKADEAVPKVSTLKAVITHTPESSVDAAEPVTKAEPSSKPLPAKTATPSKEDFSDIGRWD